MTLARVILDVLRQYGPQSRPEIECAAINAGFAPAGVPRVLWQLKRSGRVRHVRRASRYRRSIYATTDTPSR